MLSFKLPDSSNQTSRLLPTRIDIPPEVRSQEAALLNQILANLTDLKSHVKTAHWNVKGHRFYPLHLLFDEMAGELEGFIDEVAERIIILGGLAMGTIRLAAESSTLPEYSVDTLEGLSHVALLADRYALFAKQIREAITLTEQLVDMVTNDLLIQVCTNLDKRLWFLEAHLQA